MDPWGISRTADLILGLFVPNLMHFHAESKYDRLLMLESLNLNVLFQIYKKKMMSCLHLTF